MKDRQRERKKRRVGGVMKIALSLTEVQLNPNE